MQPDMYYHADSNTYVSRSHPFTLGDIQYPANWFDCASPEDVASLGLVPVNIVGERKAEEDYDNAETLLNGTLTITATVKLGHDDQSKKIRAIKDQILALEATQDRAVREAALGDSTYLTIIDKNIKKLRAKL